MSVYEHLHQQLHDGLAVQEALVEHALGPMVHGVERLVHCLLHDGRLLVCGNGAAAALAQVFTLSLMHRLELPRPGLPAICLAADAAWWSGMAAAEDLSRVYARQVEVLGAPGDMLLVLCDYDQDAAMVAAVRSAHDKGMGVIAVCGPEAIPLRSTLAAEDQLIELPAQSPARLREAMLQVLNALCSGIDYSLLGD